MRSNSFFFGTLVVALAGLALACGDDTDSKGQQDLGVQPDQGGNDQEGNDQGTDAPLAADLTVDQAPSPDREPPLTEYKIAAVQYSSDYSQVSGCTDDLCGLSHFINEAADNGAKLVVTAEYSGIQEEIELSPAVGDTPVTDSRWAEGSVVKTLAQLADQRNITLVFNLITEDGSSAYNTLLAIDGSGVVIARHYKFELFGGEKSSYTPGTSIATSFFDTPAGKVGMLICADLQCLVVHNMVGSWTTSPDCSAPSIELLKQFFFTEKPGLVLISSQWMVGGIGDWAAMKVQQMVAREANVYVAAANTTGGEGLGGGVYAPGGDPIDTVKQSTPSVTYGVLPLAQ